MKVIVAAVGVAALLAAGAAAAQDGAIFTRQQIMLTNENALMLAKDLASGAVPFNAALARSALLLIASNVEQLPNLVTEGSVRAPSNAVPAALTNRAGLVMLANKMVADARAAAASATSAQALNNSAAFKAVEANCDACHAMFRNF
jgi:cytochrome c556